MINASPAASAPAILLVGFLGAGKTTFIRELLPTLESQGMEPYVLINDYQNARIDANSLKHLVAEVEAINGNCVCCDSIHELINRLLSIPHKPNRVVLIEANGTSDPFSLIEHLVAHAELRRKFTPLIQVAVIDLKRWQKRAWHNDLERLQAESASHIVYTRTNTEKPERVASVRSDLEWLNPRSLETSPEKLANELLQLISKTTSHPRLPKFTVGKARTHRQNHALSHGFIAIQIDLPAQVDGPVFYKWLGGLPDTVLRVKGLVELAEMPGMYFTFQRTDDTPRQPTMFPLFVEPTMPPCAILIGVHLNEEEIRRDAIAKLGAITKVAA